MSPLDALRDLGRATAAKLAEVTGSELTDVYTALVAGESRGMCRVNVQFHRGRVVWVEWEAM